MTAWLFINAVGGTTISCLTLVAAGYLLVSLARQGRGKLRVRLLIGMVISDLLLGLIALVQEAMFLHNGVGLPTGSRGCNAAAFLFTGVLFTQHLWTLAIAIATFLLLKHPLSNITMAVEKYSWTLGPIIFFISYLHSGIWWATVGFSSTKNLCYYGSHTFGDNLDARDLVQFIPRALVFITICSLYSTLYSFLRRPDTIQLSSQFVSGGIQSEPRAGVQLPKLLRRKLGSSSKKSEPVNPDAPWEQMEFVQVGFGRNFGASPTPSNVSQFSGTGSIINGGILLNSRPPSPRQTQSYSHEAPPMRRLSSFGSESGPSLANDSQRPSEVETLVTPELKYEPPTQAEMIQPAILAAHVLSPVLSGGESEFDSDGKSYQLESPDMHQGGDEEMDVEGLGRRSSGQTLKEFFQANQVQVEDRGRGSGGALDTPIQMSATAYFNRQASLLMLYFPIAYMAVFSISLVRLVYSMVNKAPSPVLSLMSSWMVLSVGLIDGLVYGLAEFLVRRRVRRKIPDRI